MKSKIVVVILILLSIWVWNYATHYDANNPKHSLDNLLKTTNPNKRTQLMSDYMYTCQDDRCSNLHGFTSDEIHELAVLKKKIEQLKKTLHLLKDKIEYMKREKLDFIFLDLNELGQDSKEYSMKELTSIFKNRYEEMKKMIEEKDTYNYYNRK